MQTLEGKGAIVTGGSFGVGRGIATTLARCGARVFVTGRSVRDGAPIDEDGHIIGICCDHRVDAEVSTAFERTCHRRGHLRHGDGRVGPEANSSVARAHSAAAVAAT